MISAAGLIKNLLRGLIANNILGNCLDFFVHYFLQEIVHNFIGIRIKIDLSNRGHWPDFSRRRIIVG